MAHKTQRNVLIVILVLFCVFSKNKDGGYGNPMGEKIIKTNTNHHQYILNKVVKYSFVHHIRIGEVWLDP